MENIEKRVKKWREKMRSDICFIGVSEGKEKEERENRAEEISELSITEQRYKPIESRSLQRWVDLCQTQEGSVIH